MARVQIPEGALEIVMKCKYCQKATARNSATTLYKTDNWCVTLHPAQGYLGRCIVATKRHVESLSDLSEEEWFDFFTLVKKLEPAFKAAFGAEMFNWTCMMNNAYKEKHPYPHVHWHFRPRYRHAVHVGGITFTDSEFGSHYDRTRKTEDVTDEVMYAIAKRLSLR